MGAYAVRCSASGECWVGTTPNLDTHQNRLWFSLRLGSERHAGLQAAWNQHGEGAFTCEVLEQLKDEDTEYPEAKLKALKAKWSEKLGAGTI